MGAGNNDLRTSSVFFYINDESLGAFAAFIVFFGDLFVLGQERFCSAKIDNPAALVTALGYSADNFADTVFVFIINLFLFGITHALNNDLFGGLRRNSAKVVNFHAEAHFIIQTNRGIVFTSFGKSDLRQFVFNFFHNDFKLININFSRVFIETDFDIQIIAVSAFNGSPYCVFQGCDQLCPINAFVFADLINRFF